MVATDEALVPRDAAPPAGELRGKEADAVSSRKRLLEPGDADDSPSAKEARVDELLT